MEMCFQKIIDSFEGAFEEILPLIKFFMKHENQFSSLCSNINEPDIFSNFRRAIIHRNVHLISDFVDKLTNDNSRFVPEDGNVHHVTSKTLNFLKLLTQNRPVVSFLYEENQSQQGVKINLSKLFGRVFCRWKTIDNRFSAQMLSGLGVNLRNKAETYSDSTLGALFMFNNLSYISICASKDKNLLAILNDNNDGQLLSFYHLEIEEYLRKYLQRWTICRNLCLIFGFLVGLVSRMCLQQFQTRRTTNEKRTNLWIRSRRSKRRIHSKWLSLCRILTKNLTR